MKLNICIITSCHFIIFLEPEKPANHTACGYYVKKKYIYIFSSIAVVHYEYHLKQTAFV